MAVDAAGLAAALGVDEPEATRVLPIATALVTAYLRGGTAPEAINDEAIIRTAGHARNRLGFGIIEGKQEAGSLKIDMACVGVSSVRQSGAAALLAPYVRRTA